MAGLNDDILGKHAIPLLQTGVVVFSLQTLCQTQQYEVQHLLHPCIGFDLVWKRLAVVLELDHVAVRARLDVVRYANCARPWVVDGESRDIWEVHREGEVEEGAG